MLNELDSAPDSDIVVFNRDSKPTRLGKTWVMMGGHFILKIDPALRSSVTKLVLLRWKESFDA